MLSPANSSTPLAIDIRGVTKAFASKLAVDNLDLQIPHGSLCGFIGPNGAGKTTTIRMIMSIIFPDRGQISVLNKPSALESKDRIGYLPEERGVYRKMKVAAFLVFIAQLKGVDSKEARRRALWWLERVGLKDVARKRCEELSKGMQQKVQFVAAVIHEPDLLILDEVFSGLDPLNRRLMRDLILEQHAGASGLPVGPDISPMNGTTRGGTGQKKTIIFSTHAMYEAEQLCDRIFMIDRGVKVLDSTMREIRARFDPRTIVVEPLREEMGEHGAQRDELVRQLSAVPQVERVTLTPGGTHSAFHVSLREHADAPAAMASLMAAMAPVGGARRVELKQVTLEEVFIGLVEASGRELTAAELASLSAEGALGDAGASAGRMGGES